MAHVQSFLPDSYWQMKKAAKHPCLAQLIEAGVSYADAVSLRRISMMLHRWHELECGDSNNYGSWAIVRGNLKSERVQTEQGLNVRRDTFAHDDDGKPYLEHHHYMHGKGKDSVTHSPTPDRERAALKRLGKIIGQYKGRFAYYVQGDPRGCALYIIPKDRVRPDETVCAEWLSANYSSRGIAVYK